MAFIIGISVLVGLFQIFANPVTYVEWINGAQPFGYALLYYIGEILPRGMHNNIGNIGLHRYALSMLAFHIGGDYAYTCTKSLLGSAYPISTYPGIYVIPRVYYKLLVVLYSPKT